ncbi:hypothetical protein H4R21_004341, partial [Coemansia helicoidea]
YVDAVVAIEAAAAQAATAAADQPQGVLAAFSSAVGLLAAHSSVPADSESCAGAPSLREHIKQTVGSIWAGAERAAAAAQDESLRKMRWPGKMDTSVARTVAEFGSSFSLLAGLDRIARESHETLQANGLELRAADAAPLPLEHMARAVDIRMRYHFESARETSRADKPEWWLAHVLSMVRSLVPLLEQHAQALYDGSTLPPLDVRNEFIRLVLPIVEHKLARDSPTYVADGLVVAQVARELAAFEHTLRDVYFYDGPGVLARFLDGNGGAVFAAWIEAERKYAIESYAAAVAAPDAFELLYEQGVVGANDPSPTRIAQKAAMLIEDAAERGSAAPSCAQRLQILSTVQFPVVIALVEDVEAEIDEFSRISLAFTRDADTAAQLRRLCAWYQTVWHVEEAAANWNNSELYVELWAAVCRHARALGEDIDPRDWREGCDEWGDRDRSVLDDVADPSDDEWLDGGIWERTIGTLRALKHRVLELVSRALNKDITSKLRAYRKRADWALLGADAVPDVSAELACALPGLAQLVAMLASLVPPAALAFVLRALAAELDAFLCDRVAAAHPFNAAGGRQFAIDVAALSRVLRASAPHGRQRCQLPKAEESARVLACSLDGNSAAECAIQLPFSDWAPAIVDPTVDDREAVQVLAKLGIQHLSLQEVRRLIGRRVDWSAAHSAV